MSSVEAPERWNGLPELVLVLGKTGAGKSTFIRAATGLDVEIGDSLKSCKTHKIAPSQGRVSTDALGRYRKGTDLSCHGLAHVSDRHAGLR